jgi:hypothetical protein
MNGSDKMNKKELMKILDQYNDEDLVFIEDGLEDFVVEDVYKDAQGQILIVKGEEADELPAPIVKSDPKVEDTPKPVKIHAVTLADKCGGCRFFDTSKKYCSEHGITRAFEDDKCKSWRYFA